MLFGWELLTEEEENIIAKGIKEGKVYAGPFHLVLFPTDRCNIDCFFCYTSKLREIGDELEWNVLKGALDEGVRMGVKGVSFGGGGESFIHKSFKHILDFIESHSLKVDSIKTNGTTMTLETARRLIKLGLKRITISLNETTPETYAKISRCSPHLFEKVMSGIDNIVKAKREVGSDCEISVQIFVWKDNYHRLKEMISGILKTETDFIYLSTIDQLPMELKFNTEEKEELKDLVRDIMKTYAEKLQCNFISEGLQQFVMEEQYKISPQSVCLPDSCKTPNRIEYCYIGWYSPVIAASGDVFSCCHFSNDKEKSFGNLHKESLAEIWYGKRAQRYRAEMVHLLLTEANRELLPRRMRFISPLCLERSLCAFNYYLGSPDFYFEIHNWAESGPRKRYKTIQRMKANSYNVLRRGKRLLKSWLHF